VFVGETVTLNCEVRGSVDWKYYWALEKQGRMVTLRSSSGTYGSQYILRAVSMFDSGQYWCQAERGTDQSDSGFLTLTVIEGQTPAVVTIDPPDSVVFSGERVTLSCVVKAASGGWRYSWARNTKGRLESLFRSSAEDQKNYTLSPATVSDSGQYWCQAERGNKPIIQTHPGFLILSVSGTWPRPILTQNPSSGEIYTGDRVTLSCGVGGDSVDWKYLWYKDIQEAALLNTDSSRTDGSSYTISSAALSHSGEYWCRARRGSVVYYTDHSDSLQIEIIARPQAALTLESGWTEIFTTESVTLRCEIEMGSAGWSYKWYRNGQELPVDSSRRNGDTYTILSAAQLHNGEYTCRGESDHNKLFYSNISNPVKLKVSGKWPKPALTVFPTRGQIYTGDRVTLSCGVGGGSVGWKYLWYKDTQGEVLLNTDSSKTDGSSYTISSAALSHSGEYWCRARRGSVFYYTDRSDSLKLEIIGIWPKPVLTVFPTRGQIYTGDRVTLNCGVGGDFVGWKYLCDTDSSRTNGSSYAIIYAALSHSGEYWCRARRG
uniref:Ig-like domain-containing protein n=1 Tax=Lepisosteus oculatus TaxID=7918 RepID=W5MUH9_LEPOC